MTKVKWKVKNRSILTAEHLMHFLLHNILKDPNENM